MVYAKNHSEYVDITIHRHGQLASEHEVLRPVRWDEQSRDFDKLMDRVVLLRGEGKSTVKYRRRLEPEGFSTLRRCGAFTLDIEPVAEASASPMRRRSQTYSRCKRGGGRTRDASRCPPGSLAIGCAGGGSTPKDARQGLWVLLADKSR